MKKINTAKQILALAMCAMLLIGATACAKTKKKSLLDPDNPVTVTIWHYYNGDQLAAFEELVEEFNTTVGTEKGIVIVNESQSDINTLADLLIASVNGQAGAMETPTLAAVYAETAFILNEADALYPMDEYFTEEELNAYVSDFLNEGRFSIDNDILLFPIIKSTEIFSANVTDWADFASATGITIESITTKEQLTAAAKAYYEWSDSLTPNVAEDGKALYGRDSMANYIYIGSYQLGHELFEVENGQLEVDMDRNTFKTLWDNYYVPYINGYFAGYAKFRSEDCKTGKILSLTSSSSSVGYLPTAVTTADDKTHDIITYVNIDIPFENAVNDAIVQQGASYCMLKSTPEEMEGAVEFIKWFTESDRNLEFALMSGYSPVTTAANTEEKIKAAYQGDTSSAKGQNILNSLTVIAEAFTQNDSYATKPFNGSKEVRYILENALKNVAEKDRQAVLSSINSGMSRKEAVSPFLSDEYFDQWFNDLCEQVNEAIAE